MKTPDFAELHAEFAKSVSEFSAALLTTWSETMKRSGIQPSFGGLPALPLPGRGYPLAHGGPDPAVTAATLQEMLTQFIEDLPGVIRSFGNASKMQRVKERWTESRQRFVRQMLGIPAPSEAEQLLDQWRRILGSLSGTAGRQPAAIPFLTGPPWMGGWPAEPPTGPSTEIVRAWTEAYQRMFGYMSPLPWFPSTEGLEERTKKAADAQITFLKSLPEFQEQISEAANKSTAEIIAQIEGMNVKDLTPKTYRALFKVWLTNQQDAFQELLASESFRDSLAAAARLAVEARKGLAAVTPLCPPFGDPGVKKDLEALREKMDNVDRRLRLLEHEVEDLKRKPRGLRPREEPG